MKYFILVILFFWVNQTYAQWSDNPWKPKRLVATGSLDPFQYLYDSNTQSYFCLESSSETIHKFDSNGNKILTISLTGKNVSTATVDNQGNLILFGFVGFELSDAKILAYKVNGSTGAQMWNSGTAIVVDTMDVATDVDYEPDGVGGVFIKYRDSSNKVAIQHIDGNGNLWANPVFFPTDNYINFKMTSDKQGGLYLLYKLNGFFCSHMLSDGTVQWTKTLPYSFSSNSIPTDFKLVADNASVFLTYSLVLTTTTSRTSLYRITIGGVEWANPETVTTALRYPLFGTYADKLRIKPDGQGGCFVFWASEWFASGIQRFNSSGTKLWAESGVVVGAKAVEYPDETFPIDILPDNSGGCAVAWSVKSTNNNDFCFVQKINAAGVLQFGNTGRFVGKLGRSITGRTSYPYFAPHLQGYILLSKEEYEALSGIGGYPTLAGMVISTAGNYVGTSTVKKTAQSGNWSASSTWVGGVVPSTNDSVIVQAGHTLTLNQNAHIKQLVVLGSFTMNARELTVGKIGGDIASLAVVGSFTMNGNSVVRINGYVKCLPGSNFTMAGGELIADGYDNTLTINLNEHLLDFGFVDNLTITGGKIIIKDFYSGQRESLILRKPISSSSKVIFGNEINRHQSIFAIELGKLEVPASTINTFEISIVNIGTTQVIIKDSVINLNPKISIGVTGCYKGNLVNNGIMSCNCLGSPESPATMPQYITGTGDFNMRESSSGSGVFNTSVQGVEMRQGSLRFSPMNMQMGKLKLIDTDLIHEYYNPRDNSGNQDSYIILSGTSKLDISSTYPDPVFYPIGTENYYAPVSTSCNYDYGEFLIRPIQNSENVPSAARVPLDWEITRTYGNCNPTITLNWLAGSEVGGFNKNQLFLARQNNTTWDNTIGPVAASGSSLLSLTHNFGVFGKFRIYSITPPCPQILTLVSTADDVSIGTVSRLANSTNGTINAANKITGNANVNYQARSISLNNGFVADAGTIFLAQTGGCQ